MVASDSSSPLQPPQAHPGYCLFVKPTMKNIRVYVFCFHYVPMPVFCQGSFPQVIVAANNGDIFVRFVWDGIPWTVAKQPLWPRGKAINESAANKKEVPDLSPTQNLSNLNNEPIVPIHEGKAMADMHQRKAGMAKHSDNEEDVEVSEEKTHDIETSQSLQKVEQHLQTLCFSVHRRRPRYVTPPPLTKEQIEGHVSALKSLIKDHNQRNKTDPIHLDFELEDTKVRDQHIVNGKEVVDEDVKKPFKEARKTPITSRIIEFAGPKYKMPANIKLHDGTPDPEDHLSRFASAANSGE
ncbi:hypothetical protein Tco_0302886 [Tanacetum coccineum]